MLLYCLSLFQLQNVHPSRSALNVFHNLDKNLFASYLCDLLNSLCHDSLQKQMPHSKEIRHLLLEASVMMDSHAQNIRWPPTSCFSTDGNFCLSEQSKNAVWGAFHAACPFSFHSPPFPHCWPHCRASHFFFAQTIISPNPQGKLACRLLESVL